MDKDRPTGIAKAGIDSNLLKAHSVCTALTSAAVDAGISISEVLEAADWSSASTFKKFYYQPVKSSKFGLSVVSSASNLQSWYGKPNSSKYN